MRRRPQMLKFKWIQDVKTEQQIRVFGANPRDSLLTPTLQVLFSEVWQPIQDNSSEN